MIGIVGRKVGMTQLLTSTGVVVPVTIIEAGPCYVTQVKTPEKDGYVAVQLGFQETRQKRLTKGQLGHLRRNNLPALRVLREFRVKSEGEYKVGEKILADLFVVGEQVDVMGISKGRGFQGGVKRHGFHGGPRTHGQSDRLRAPGASSSGTTPGRVYKGKRMAGRLGGGHVTVQNLRVVEADANRHLLLIRGSLPGGVNGVVLIKKALKKR